ncbi:protein serine/threonine kinase [Ectocarpus siliculosus]|uniref:Protein serine/threonine kinase n=1 Tax=Ectocarpus siliculosus TaxID=2880 RepID=D7G917_ECTSI|nr:protein serine/threonine kinase [Ectocarpus siliculosus]|eukprot:CBJ28178.1 protein serine/threonine kinase [Ectocarpus siliculosus]
MEVAVKIIPADNPADLLKEVDIMLACTSPYIVRLHDCFYKDNEAWLVMDFVGGGSVCDILEACQVTLSEEEARECTAWTVLALDYLHSNRKLHRDVKAGNILLTLDGRAKLADFGVSKEVNTMANKAQTVIGTPYWMAPEVIQEVPYNGQADIWSLAITCIEMVEGNPPLHNVHPMRAIFMIPSKPSPTLSEPAKWSLEFNDFVGRCLEKKPDDRPSSRAILREASDAKANMAGQESSEDGSGSKTATLRRMR